MRTRNGWASALASCCVMPSGEVLVWATGDSPIVLGGRGGVAPELVTTPVRKSSIPKRSVVSVVKSRTNGKRAPGSVREKRLNQETYESLFTQMWSYLLCTRFPEAPGRDR